MDRATLRRLLLQLHKRDSTLTKTAIAERFGIHRVTLQGWLAGKYPIPKWVELALKGLDTERGKP